ncbi:MAG: ABC transporter ATP-binding protein, partial [Nakamurella sp.]
GVSAVLSGLCLAGLAWFAGGQAAAGSITIGELVAVLGLAQFLQWPMSGLAFVGAELATARASAVRVATVLQSTPVWDQLTEPTPPGGLELRLLRGTTFGPLNLSLAPGTVVALCVESPESATELVDVLARRRPATGGSMLIGGVEISGPETGSTAPVVVAPPHHAAILAGTLADNVLPACAVNDPRLAAVGAAAAFDDVIRDADGGWSAQLGERGLTLSGGQRQRLTLARALATEAPILVLHDPTSAVDSVTEFTIAAGVRGFRGQGATLLVTSSPALLAVADQVLVLRDGRVTDNGTHHDLMARSEQYRGRVAG